MATPGLRELKKQRTRQLISDTARRLFSQRGFENVSVADIAEAAEVAPATVFNYFQSKEDLVYGRLETFEDELLGAIRSRASGETVLEAFSRFVLQPRGFLSMDDDAQAAELMALTRTIASSPALLAREQQIFARYTDVLAELIASETRARPGDLRPHTAANAMIGVHRSLIAYVRQRLVEGPVDRRDLARDVRRSGRAALTLLADGLGTYATKR